MTKEIQNISKLSKRYTVTFTWSHLGSLEKENIKHTLSHTQPPQLMLLKSQLSAPKAAGHLQVGRSHLTGSPGRLSSWSALGLGKEHWQCRWENLVLSFLNGKFT